MDNSDSGSDWNLVSIPFKLNNWELNNGTNNGYNPPVQPSNCINSLWRYNASSEDWDRTDYIGGNWSPGTGDENFTILERARGYWFEVEQSCNLTFVGEVPTDNFNVSLFVGWNIRGWHSTNISTLPTYEENPSPITTNPANAVDAIDRYNTNTDSFEVTMHYDDWGWWPSYNNEDFTTIDPGVGYYFDVDPNADWSVDPNT
jgi:hypothetical protein